MTAKGTRVKKSEFREEEEEDELRRSKWGNGVTEGWNNPYFSLQTRPPNVNQLPKYSILNSKLQWSDFVERPQQDLLRVPVI